MDHLAYFYFGWEIDRTDGIGSKALGANGKTEHLCLIWMLCIGHFCSVGIAVKYSLILTIPGSSIDHPKRGGLKDENRM